MRAPRIFAYDHGFVKLLPPEPPRLPLGVAPRQHLERDAWKKLATLLCFLDAWFDPYTRQIARQPKKGRVTRPEWRRTRTILAVQVLKTCPAGRVARGEYQPPATRPDIFSYTPETARHDGYDANPEAWSVEPRFVESRGYVGGLADAVLGPEADLAGFVPELRLAKEAYAEATTGGSDAEWQASRNRWRDEHGDREQPEYAGFAQDLDEQYLDYKQDFEGLKAEYETTQRTLKRLCKGALQDRDPEKAIRRCRTRLAQIRIEKEALVERWSNVVKEAA